jgi:hypothetical protein
MKHAVEMDSGAMIYIPSSIKIYLGFQMLIGGYTDTQNSDLISLLFFSK